MKEQLHLSRRGFMAANAAAAALTTVPLATSAGTPSPTGATIKSSPMTWTQISADGFESLIGDRFHVSTAEAGAVVMTLIAVERVDSGPHRPSDLPRSHGITAVFDSPDKQPLIDCGHATHRVSHPRLGSADLFMGPTCLREGGHEIEIVLN